MTDEQKARLAEAIIDWREQVRGYGSMHPSWELISDAEALIAGKPTGRSWSDQEAYEICMKYRVKK